MNSKINIAKLKIKYGFSLFYFIVFMFMVFSNFYIYKAKPFSPMYVFYFIGLFLCFFTLLKNKIKINKLQIFSLICILYIIITSFFQVNNVLTSITVVTALSYFFIGTYLLKFLNLKKVIYISNSILFFSGIYISLETLYRLTHPILARSDSLQDPSMIQESFYMFKLNSFVCTDSNFIGIMSLILTFFSYYLYKKVNKQHLYRNFMLFFSILTFLSLSRASIAGLVISIIIFFSIDFVLKHMRLLIAKKQLTYKFLIFLICTMIVIPFIFLLLFSVFDKFILDSSFRTKIIILTKTINAYKVLSPTQILIGAGNSLDIAKKYLGMYPHNILSLYLLWQGVIGTFLIYGFWGYIIRKIPSSIFIFLPIFINGISLTYIGLHLFYVVIAIMFYMENKLFKRFERIVE